MPDSGPVAEEKFCLKWQDFTSNVNSSFKNFRSEKDFLDVCLITKEGELFAHKVILSAGSPFFRDVFKKSYQLQLPGSTTQISCIFMIGASYRNVASILDFVYEGEVRVLDRDLNDFLALAEELQIKGLTNKHEPSSPSSPSSSSSPSSPKKSAKARLPSLPTVPMPLDEVGKEGEPPMLNVQWGCVIAPHTKKPLAPSIRKRSGPKVSSKKKRLKQEPGSEEDAVMTTILPPSDDLCAADLEENSDERSLAEDKTLSGGYEESDGGGNAEETSHNDELLMDLPDGRCQCRECDKVFASRHNAKKHVQGIHDAALSVQCRLCHKVYKNKFTFRSHILYAHDIHGSKILESYGQLIKR